MYSSAPTRDAGETCRPAISPLCTAISTWRRRSSTAPWSVVLVLVEAPLDVNDHTASVLVLLLIITRAR
jgi:hypothetical protein